MLPKTNLILGVILLLLVLASDAPSQTACNCAQASLVGDTVGTRLNQGPGPINRVVGSGLELPNAGPILGAAGSAPRWNIDFTSNAIRIDFLQQPATYGGGSYFTFSSLDPQMKGCPPAFISGITVTTNKPTTPFNVVAAATFGPNTVTIQIAPTGGNLDWQPGEFILVKLNFACATGSQGNDCRGNRVTNGNFTSGLNGWSAAYGTPDYGNSMGAQDPGFVGMWGNMNPTIGEGLQQNLGANQLVSGKTYLVSLQVRRLNDPNKLPYAKFKVRASTASLSSAAGGITVGLTGNITATTWTPVSFNWTAPAGGPFPFLTLSVENNSSVNDGSKTSYGHFDNICIRETPSLPCCECLGQVTTLNLDTGQSSPVDPIWTVNGNAAFTTPKVASWISLPPANWIQPVPSPTPSSSLAPGVYRYSVSFNIPKCTIPSEVRLEGKFSADNSARAYLDSPSKVVGTCPGPTCFAGSASFSVPASYLTPGNHTLVIEVRNNESYSGLIVNAKLTRQCARGNPRQTTDHTIDDAIGIR